MAVYVPLLAGELIAEAGALAGEGTLAGITATLGAFHVQMEARGGPRSPRLEFYLHQSIRCSPNGTRPTTECILDRCGD